MQLNELEMEPYTAAAATLAVNAPPPPFLSDLLHVTT